MDNVGKVFRLDTEGRVLAFFGIDFRASGLAWDGKALWFADESNGRLVQMTPSGQVLETLPVYYWPMSGLAWDGTHLWAADYNLARLYRHRPDGELALYFNLPTGVSDTGWLDPNLRVEHPTGMTFDGEALWVGDSNEGFQNNVARVSLEGNLLGGFDTNALGISPATWPEVKALAWGGRHLWYSADDLSTVYRLDVGAPAKPVPTPSPAVPFASVAPTPAGTPAPTPAPGTLEVRTDPSGVAVYPDGEYGGKTSSYAGDGLYTAKVQGLLPGTYVLKLARDGYLAR